MPEQTKTPIPDTPLNSAPGQLWYALHVRSQYEKTVLSILQSKGFVGFLPTYISRRQWSQRIAEVEVPLFPRYVFCRFDTSERRVPILTTPGVMGIVGFGGKPASIGIGEIEAIHRVLETGYAAEPWKYTVSGQRVRVEHGALAGLEGIFVGVKKNHRLLLSLSLLQRSVAIEMDAAWVVPLKASTESYAWQQSLAGGEPRFTTPNAR